MIEKIDVQIKLLPHFEGEGMEIPAKKNPFDGGMDVRVAETVTLQPGETKPIKTGFSVNTPPGWKIRVVSRSGLSIKGIKVANAPAIIDTNYLDEVFMITHNSSSEPFTINRGDRIGQMYIDRVYDVNWVKVDEFTGDWLKDRGGGLGSTGVSQ